MKRTSPEFLSLQAEWYSRLKLEGFQDIEDKKGNLKLHNRRTISFDNRDLIRDFFMTLDHYLGSDPDIPEKHRRILALYSEGMHIKQIAERVNKHRKTIWETIKKYKAMILKQMEVACNDVS